MSQAIILDRCQSITLADIWTNLTGMPSGSVALFVSKDLNIFFISLVIGFG